MNIDLREIVSDDFGFGDFIFRNPNTLEEVARAVDAVSVVTTSVAHCEVGEFFLNKGIHCMMEKPLATTEEVFSCHVSTCRVFKADNLGFFAGY